VRNEWRHAFRVTFEAEGSHDVLAQSEDRAAKLAAEVRRYLKYVGPACRVVGTPVDLGHRVGGGTWCPRCRALQN